MPTPNFSAYRPEPDTLGDAGQIDNFIDACQDVLNNVGDEAKMTWATGLIFDLAKFKQSGASANQVPVWSGSAWVPQTITDLNTYYKKATAKDVASTVVKTDLLNAEITIGAGKLSANGLIKVYAKGDYQNNSGSTRTIRLEFKLGSQVIWDSDVSDTISTASARRSWRFQAEIQALASTSAQGSGGYFGMNDNQAAVTGLGCIRDQAGHGVAGDWTGEDTTVDMTTGQTLTLKVTHSNADCSMRLRHARVEVFA